MNRHFFAGTFLVGAVAIIWVGTGFWGGHLLALAMTAIIAATYGFGALELKRFRETTAALSAALEAIPQNLTHLGDWLATVPAPLRNTVKLRIEGERSGLPGPALTPYLVGLLVMLGMLGTFLGMVVTLNTAVFALEGTTDLQAMRSVFAAPIKGLGLAFGTSVAGVAASAMLGLMSAISRRERMQAAHRLDTHIATTLSIFSHTHQRQEAYKALQVQSQALPQVVEKLQMMLEQMTQMAHSGQQLNERLIGNQEAFHQDVKTVYADLASTVDQTLRDSLSQSALVAAQSIKPIIETTMAGLIANTDRSMQSMSETFGHRASELLSDIKAANASVQAEQVTRNSHTLAEFARLSESSETLIRSRVAAEATWTHVQSDRMDQLVTLLRTELGALRDAEAQRGNAAIERLGDLQAALTDHLTTLGKALEDPIARLIETASEAPRAAAEVIGTLRQEISASMARDNELLDERSRILLTLNGLLDGINHASLEQRAVIDSLVVSSAEALRQVGHQFSNQVDMQASKLTDVAAEVTSSAVEVSSLGETFSFAVRAFGESNDKLIANLQRIESALSTSMARSDEQLAYYVAQAREVIDLSVMSQREVFEELRRLAVKKSVPTEEVVHG